MDVDRAINPDASLLVVASKEDTIIMMIFIFTACTLQIHAKKICRLSV